MYNLKTGKHLSALSENGRHVYHIKDGKYKNDLNEDGIVLEKTDEFVKIVYLLEMATN